MTKEEVLAKLKELGLDVNGATEEVIQKAQAWLEDQKAQLDTETRRKRALSGSASLPWALSSASLQAGSGAP